MGDVLSWIGVLLTLVVLESVLSFDNAAILTVLSRMVPDARDRRRALNYGLGIAYALRVVAILGAVVLIQHPVFQIVGGLYLVALCGRHFWQVTRSRHKGTTMPGALRNQNPWLSRFGLPAFTAIILQIGVVDLVFALDQVVAAVGFTTNYYLILAAAAIGLTSLRLLSPLISRLMDWLPVLEHMAFVAVGFVGVLLVLSERPFELHAPDWAKVGITLGLFALPIAWKLVARRARTANA